MKPRLLPKDLIVGLDVALKGPFIISATSSPTITVAKPLRRVPLSPQMNKVFSLHSSTSRATRKERKVARSRRNGLKILIQRRISASGTYVRVLK